MSAEQRAHFLDTVFPTLKSDPRKRYSMPDGTDKLVFRFQPKVLDENNMPVADENGVIRGSLLYAVPNFHVSWVNAGFDETRPEETGISAYEAEWKPAPDADPYTALPTS